MTTPTSGLPGSGTGSQATPSTSGLPSYNDLPTQTTTTSYTPGTTEWWQQELGSLYGQKVLVGISTKTNPGADTPGGNAPSLPHHDTGETSNNFQTTEALYKQVMGLAIKSPQDFMAIQGLLYDAGYFGDSSRASVHWGQWTDQTGSALKQALGSYEGAAVATGTPVTWTEFLSNAAQRGRLNQAQGGVGGSGPSGGAASQAVLTDPAALKATLQQAAMQSLDRALSPDELDKFVTSFQSQQQAAQQSTAGTVTNPDASAQALQFVQNNNQDEFQQHNATAYGNSLLNLFLPAGSQLANFTPNASVK